MFELTNDQRKCFALEPIHDQWVCIEAKPSPYDQFKTYLYLDGDTIVKCILSGDSQYCEYELSEKVSNIEGEIEEVTEVIKVAKECIF